MSSEYGEDLFIQDHIDLPPHGFYLDLGCAWPHLHSNTEFLRNRGWNGLAVDGNPAYAEDWKEIDHFRCAVVYDGQPVDFLYLPNPDLSRIGSGVGKTLSLTLAELTSDCPGIDFISCDLEGAEYEALRHLDWTRHRPQVVIAEYNTFGKGEDMRVRDFLTQQGYYAAFQTAANIVFAREL